jgi:thiosulfate/3-mercaptopyruvate sulfurtransferase
MNFNFGRIAGFLIGIVIGSFCLILAGCERSQMGSPETDRGRPDMPRASSPVPSDLMQPEDLAGTLRSNDGIKPLILYVGFRVLYTQAHIAGSEFIGPGASQEGLQQLRTRVQSLPRTQPIVIYCGCCPWNDCPNMNPAYGELRFLGFKDVRRLYIPNNFGKDWVERGYPVEKGL